MRLARSLCLIAAISLATAPPVSAQDTTPATVEITPPAEVTVGEVTVVAVDDSTRPDTTAVVWPEHFTIKNFVLANQMAVTILLVSIVLFGLAQFSWFAELRDGVTRTVQGIVGALISWLVLSWGGTPDAALGALITGAVSVFAGGVIFQMGRSQPGNTIRGKK